MVERLKRWESPRRKGRNDKGRGGSARQRQLKKRQKMLLKKLKQNSENNKTNLNERRDLPLLFFIGSSQTDVRIRLCHQANLVYIENLGFQAIDLRR